MRRSASALALILLVVIAGCARALSRRANEMGPAPSAEDPGTAWDGVYTAEQSRRGERVARLRCFPCHTAEEWGSSRFMNLSSRGGLGEVYRIIRSTMPPNNPGGLRDDQYASLLAYILRLRGVTPGETQLPSDPEELLRIIGPPGAAGLGSNPATISALGSHNRRKEAGTCAAQR